MTNTPPGDCPKTFFHAILACKNCKFPAESYSEIRPFSPFFPSQIPFVSPALYAAHFVCNPIAENGKEGDEGGGLFKNCVQKLFAKTRPSFLVLSESVEWLTVLLFHESPINLLAFHTKTTTVRVRVVLPFLCKILCNFHIELLRFLYKGGDFLKKRVQKPLYF